jgi:hypothetical protein
VRVVFPCEDGHAQERTLLGQVLATVQAGDLWMQNRNFCPWAFLSEIDSRGAGCITRQYQGLPFEVVSALRSVGRIETGHVAEQRVQVWDAQGVAHLFRRLRVKLDEATRDGDRVLSLLTNLRLRKAAAKRVARLYRKRWTLETAFPHLEADFHAEINTLGSPKADWFGFCLALVAYNMLAVVLAALRSVHGETIAQELSLDAVANDIAQTYHGMMMAIPEDEWRVFSRMRPAEMVAMLRELPRRYASRGLEHGVGHPNSPGVQYPRPRARTRQDDYDDEHEDEEKAETLPCGAAHVANPVIKTPQGLSPQSPRAEEAPAETRRHLQGIPCLHRQTTQGAKSQCSDTLTGLMRGKDERIVWRPPPAGHASIAQNLSPTLPSGSCRSGFSPPPRLALRAYQAVTQGRARAPNAPGARTPRRGVSTNEKEISKAVVGKLNDLACRQPTRSKLTRPAKDITVLLPRVIRGAHDIGAVGAPARDPTFFSLW